jgi:hypothetical protein
MAISPISSRPTCEVKPTRAPRTGRLWAKMEQEPPRVRLNPEPSNCRPVGKFLEEAIEDEVEIGFAADGDVHRGLPEVLERWGIHWKDLILFCCATMRIMVIIT